MSSDKDFEENNPVPGGFGLPEGAKNSDSNTGIPAIPAPEQEDLPGIPVHDPRSDAEKSKQFGANPFHGFTRMSKKKRLGIIAGGLALAIGASAFLVPTLWLRSNKLPDVALLEHYSPIEAVKIYDRFNHLTAVVAGAEDRQAVPLTQVSPNMRRAMLGAEDHDFYKHGGINPSSIVRAFMVNIAAGHIVEGGSTITQQLVKNLFFPGEERTFNRKIKEFFLANEVARRYPKDKILEMYLNQIYFGNQAYGIERAAQRYFSKPASKLTLAESAFIAGLVKAPSYLSNPANRKDAISRQHEVLDKLAEYKLASAAEVQAAKSQKLAFRKYVSPYQKYPYYISYVTDLLREKYGDQEMQKGMKVYTYLDPVAQEAAEASMADGIKHAPSGVTQGALVSMKVDDAGVLALVGGVGKFEQHQWNRAVTPHTMGSCFKPFVYLTGFMKGLTPDSIVLDEPFSVPSGGHVYSPRNFDNTFKGPMPIRTALALSRNVCAIRVAVFDGINSVINTARLAGITSRLDPYIPIALGAGAASPLEMAGAYGTFARGGVQMTPQMFRHIDTNDDKVIASFDATPHKVFDSNAVAELVDAMQTVVKSGTGTNAQLAGRPVAGKTGTSDAARDVWFCGFTPDLVTTVWGGNDHNKAIPGSHVTGGVVMAGMWKKYMVSYYDKHPTPIGMFMAPSKSQTQVALNQGDLSQPNAVSGAGGYNADVASASAVDPWVKPKLIAKKMNQPSASTDAVVEYPTTQSAVIEPAAVKAKAPEGGKLSEHVQAALVEDTETSPSPARDSRPSESSNSGTKETVSEPASKTESTPISTPNPIKEAPPQPSADEE